MSSQHVSAPYVTIFFHIRTVHLDIIKVFLFTNWYTRELS